MNLNDCSLDTETASKSSSASDDDDDKSSGIGLSTAYFLHSSAKVPGITR